MLGQGFDTFTNSAAGNQFVKQNVAPTAQGGQVCNISVCTSLEQLSRSLSISASASASYGAASVSDKASFVQSLQVTTTSVTVVVYANRTTTSTLYPYEIVDGRSKPDAASFCEAYGDTFVTTLTTGSEYMAVYVFYSQSKDEQTSVTNTLKASGVYGGATVSASVTTALSTTMSSTTTRTTLQQQIFGVTGLTFPAASDIASFALAFGTITPNAPAIISFATTGYEEAFINSPGTAPHDWANVVTNRTNYLVGASGTPGYAQELTQLYALQSQIAWIAGIYQIYSGPKIPVFSDPKLQSAKDQVNADINTLVALINSINAAPATVPPAPKLPSLSLGSPSLAYSALPVAGQVWGGSGGGPFQDVTAKSVLSGTVLASISAVYDNDSPDTHRLSKFTDQYLSSGGTTTTLTRGKGGGKASVLLTLASGEFITSIGGKWHTYMDQLVLTTNLGQSWSCGSTGKNTIAYTVPAGSVLLGFQGRSGSALDQLQPLALSFKPAAWTT
jgi:hypothetical protein